MAIMSRSLSQNNPSDAVKSAESEVITMTSWLVGVADLEDIVRAGETFVSSSIVSYTEHRDNRAEYLQR